MSRIIALFTVCASWTGLFLMFIQAEEGIDLLGETYVVEQRYQRTMVGFTASFVFTRSRHFARMVNTMSRSLQACWPFIFTALLVMLAFGELCELLYKDADTPPYFTTTSRSFTTVFQIFVGEWTEIMWDISVVTNYGTTLLFVVYAFFSTLLFGQLVLGVIISVFVEADSFASSRIYDAIVPVYQNLNETEREALVADFLTINYRLIHIHEQIEILTTDKRTRLGTDWETVFEWNDTPGAASQDAETESTDKQMDKGMAPLPGRAAHNGSIQHDNPGAQPGVKKISADAAPGLDTEFNMGVFSDTQPKVPVSPEWWQGWW